MFDRETCPVCGKKIHAERDGDDTILQPHVLPRRSVHRGYPERCPGSGLVLPPTLYLRTIQADGSSEPRLQPSAA
jgi:hypothetical protein